MVGCNEDFLLCDDATLSWHQQRSELPDPAAEASAATAPKPFVSLHPCPADVLAEEVGAQERFPATASFLVVLCGRKHNQQCLYVLIWLSMTRYIYTLIARW